MGGRSVAGASFLKSHFFLGPLLTAVIIACLGTLYLGIQPGGLLGLTGEAIRSLVG